MCTVALTIFFKIRNSNLLHVIPFNFDLILRIIYIHFLVVGTKGESQDLSEEVKYGKKYNNKNERNKDLWQFFKVFLRI